jgi:hypothetical protein
MINSPYSQSSKFLIIPEEKKKKKVTLKQIFKNLKKPISKASKLNSKKRK